MAPSHREAGLQRRDLLGLLLDGDSSSSTATGTAHAATSTTAGGGGILGGITSVVGDATSAVGGILQPTTSTSSSTSTSTSSSSTSSTVSTTSSSSSTSSSGTSSSASTTSSSTTSSSRSTSVSSTASTSSAPQTTPQPAEALSTYVSTSANQVITITATRSASDSSASETATTQAGGSHQSFLQNKPLSGVVFALVGIVGLAIIVVISTWFVRRSRRNRLERDAELFTDTSHWPDDAAAVAAASEKRELALSRSPSDRTAHTNMGSDEALMGAGSGMAGYGAAYGGQMQHPAPAPAPGMGFNPLPAPPGLSGPRGPGPTPPQPAMQSYGASYESPYATFQQPQTMYNMPQQQQQANVQRSPTNGSAWSGSSSGQPSNAHAQSQTSRGAPMPTIPQEQGVSRASDGSLSTHHDQGQGPPSVFGRDSNQGPGLGTHAGAAGIADVRVSTGSDAYADYAFATGPGQNGSQPRKLTIANA